MPLLLVAVVLVYKSLTPWNDHVAKILIWVVFGTSLAIKLGQVAEMLLAGKVSIPFIVGFGVVYMAIFGYLFWLHSQSKRYCSKS